MSTKQLIWVEINRAALEHNIKELRRLIGPDVILNAVVKSNAYGHDLVTASKIFIEGGADWLSVHSLLEAETLRSAGVTAPIYILGYVQLRNLKRAVELDCRMVVYNQETIEKLGEIGKPVKVHIKVETGTHRQGALISALEAFVNTILKYPNITIEGVSTHFANIEDTINDEYYQKQLAEFEEGVAIIEKKVITPLIKHCAAAAAAIVFPESHFDMVRFGVSLYGMWPSEKIYAAYKAQDVFEPITLQPAFTWKSRIAQIKKIQTGEFIGYGCAYETTRPTEMAVIPVGYYDGYVRAVGSKAHVLIAGKPAPVMGRVSMNNIVVDVTDIEGATLEDEVVLIGKQDGAEITAEQFAQWAETINYEITTRVSAGVNSNIPRIIV